MAQFVDLGVKGNRIDAQRLNRRLAVLRAAAGSNDGFGTGPGALQVLCWRLASVKPARRRETFEAGTPEARAELSAWLRFDGVTRTIAATDQVALDGQLYAITARPLEVGLRGGIELLLISTGQAINAQALAAVP